LVRPQKCSLAWSSAVYSAAIYENGFPAEPAPILFRYGVQLMNGHVPKIVEEPGGMIS
jgi:hypothetical protein